MQKLSSKLAVAAVAALTMLAGCAGQGQEPTEPPASSQAASPEASPEVSTDQGETTESAEPTESDEPTESESAAPTESEGSGTEETPGDVATPAVGDIAAKPTQETLSYFKTYCKGIGDIQPMITQLDTTSVEALKTGAVKVYSAMGPALTKLGTDLKALPLNPSFDGEGEWRAFAEGIMTDIGGRYTKAGTDIGSSNYESVQDLVEEVKTLENGIVERNSSSYGIRVLPEETVSVIWEAVPECAALG